MDVTLNPETPDSRARASRLTGDSVVHSGRSGGAEARRQSTTAVSITRADGGQGVDTLFLAADEMPALVWSTGPGGACEFVNRRWLEFTGAASRAALTDTLDFVHPDDVEHRRALLSGEGQPREPFESVFRLRRADGTYRWVLDHGSPRFDAQGAFRGYAGVSVDVTEWRAAQRELLVQRTFLRNVLDTDPNLIFVKDYDGKFVLVNRAVADIYGTTVDAIVGKRDADFNPRQEEVEWFLRDDREVMDTLHEKFITEEKITDKAGHLRWLQTVKRPLIDSDGRARQVLGIATDITARKSLEAQLLQSQKMEAIGRLAGGVAHDFNNLLTAILGYSHLLLGELPDARSREQVEQIRNAALRAAALTRQLLTFSRQQVVAPRVFPMNAVVRDAESLLRRLIGEDVELITELESADVNVRADPVQLQQTILNLAVNAREAMPDGGVLRIRTEDVEIDPDTRVGSEPARPGRYVMLSVSDTGLGVSDEHLPHLFEPFFTTKERGTGLGLSTVFGIVRQADGHIRVDSRPGHGATFSIYLPAVSGPRTNGDVVESTAAFRGEGTLLLVEDEREIREIMVEMLARCGFTVHAAGCGEDALRLLDQIGGRLDLLITDMVMPRMNGRDLAARVLAVRPKVKVLYITGYTDTPLSDDVPAGRAILCKPFTLDGLTRAIRELMES
ncbi:Blue-light-activated protein [Phycisphaerae bacterium RAS1]|nr:Blue-light-activated protein [Phycisphaerae bacterium RAS1]